MKILRNILLAVATLASWIIIGISGTVRADIAGKTADAIQYSVLLCLSLLYLQWALDRFLLPISSLPKADRQELLRSARSKYKAGFFAGTTGFGYILLTLYVISLFANPGEIGDVPNFIIAAVFFIVIGTIAEARTLVKMLAEERADNRKESQQQNPELSPVAVAPDEA